MILTPFEEILGQDESTEVALGQIDGFPGHPFQVRLDEDMEKLIESIGQSGVIVPVILRKSRMAGMRRLRGTAVAPPAGSWESTAYRR